MKGGRHDAILEALEASGTVEVTTLAKQLGVSEITVRRDLLELEAAGYLRRVHGGAMRTTGRAFDRPYLVRERQDTATKRAIAAAAARLVKSGDAIALDSGTTVLNMVEFLGGLANLTLVTANLRTAWTVANSRTLLRPFRLIVSGGVVREDELSMVGASALSHYRKMRVDIAFIGVGGVNAKAGITDYNLDDAELKRVLVESARRVVILADRSKLGNENFAQVAELSEIDMLITDSGADPVLVKGLRDAGVEVQQVDPADAPDGR